MIGSLIPAVLALLFAFTMIAAAVLAHRGQAFWGTWMMLIGSIGTILGTVGAGIAIYLMFNAMGIASGASPSASPSSSAIQSMTFYSLISGISTLLAFGGLLAFAVGLLALTVRYGAVVKRVDDLEAITATLVSEREQGA